MGAAAARLSPAWRAGAPSPPHRQARTGVSIFLSDNAPASTKATPTLPLIWACTASDTRMPLGRRLAFQTRGDIDPVAEDIVVVDNDVAEVDADAELDRGLARPRAV